MKTTRMTPALCPWCGYTLDAAGNMKDQIPKEGDFTVCLGCVSVLRFGPGLKLEIPSRAEIDAQIAADRDAGDNDGSLEQIRAAIRMMHAKLGPPRGMRGTRQ